MGDGFDRIMSSELAYKGEASAPIYMVASLRRIADYSRGICENTIDYSAQRKQGQ